MDTGVAMYFVCISLLYVAIYFLIVSLSGVLTVVSLKFILDDDTTHSDHFCRYCDIMLSENERNENQDNYLLLLTTVVAFVFNVTLFV